MSRADEYRKIAEECDRLALEAKTETDRLALLDLAHSWLDSASRQEEINHEREVEEAEFDLTARAGEDPAFDNAPRKRGWLWRWFRVNLDI
jgi:hypothetical protein